MIFSQSDYFLLGVIGVQIVAAYLAFGIFRYNRLAFNWLAMAWGMVFISMGSAFVLLSGMAGLEDYQEKLLFAGNYVFPLVASILFVFALFGMRRAFESFDVIEKKAMVKMKEFDMVVGKKARKK